MRRKDKFRVGQRVQLASDPTHTFVIDKSLVPERIYRERRSNRWWTKSELQRLGAPENPATSIRLNGKAKCVQMRGKCVQVVSGQSTSTDKAAFKFPPRECLFAECRVKFQPKRKWQQFHSTSCRYAYWQRQRSPRKAPQIVAATACDTMATVN